MALLRKRWGKSDGGLERAIDKGAADDRVVIAECLTSSHHLSEARKLLSVTYRDSWHDRNKRCGDGLLRRGRSPIALRLSGDAFRPAGRRQPPPM
jgi:hypothetical protein